MLQDLHLGKIRVQGCVGLAPMAGYTDGPFRRACRRQGAAFAVAEMVSANPRVRGTRKSATRLLFPADEPLRIAQIAGSDPAWCAEAARHAVSEGAHIVDINMGCPAKKVCNTLAGSALLRDPPRVRAIVRAVVGAVAVPVTLKTRLGWDRESINIHEIARIAEGEGIVSIAIHARTRACRFTGAVDYAPIRAVKSAAGIPVLVNGDLRTAADVVRVLAQTGADGALIGRAAMGNPWIFAEVRALLGGTRPVPADLHVRAGEVIAHIADMHDFYGEDQGVRLARKHVGAYLETLGQPRALTAEFNALDSAEAQRAFLEAALVPAAYAPSVGTTAASRRLAA